MKKEIVTNKSWLDHLEDLELIPKHDNLVVRDFTLAEEEQQRQDIINHAILK